MRALVLVITGLHLVSIAAAELPAGSAGRLRLIVETDAGGDPDDEQSLVRFLLYANEWDVEGIIANRAQAREGENRNPERTGLGIVRQLLSAYGECYPSLSKHDPRYPRPELLWQRTVPGYNDTEAAANLIIAAVDSADPRPVWYSDWGTDHGAATNNLRRALERVLRERGPDGYARFKSRLRLSSADAFGTYKLDPPFPLWVDTFRPELNGRRWYHRFSALTAHAGGFDLIRDVVTGHGPLGALYPTNTTHWAKEGDSMTFLYLVPTGMNDPDQPTWGSWAGRYGLNTNVAGPRPEYYWANQDDAWNGSTNRDNTLARWAAHLQNDVRARLDWCVKGRHEANHPPEAQVNGELRRTVRPGETVRLDAGASADPDGQSLSFEWLYYPEPGSYRGPAIDIQGVRGARASFVAPDLREERTIHVILIVTDSGSPPLTRYRRLVITVSPEPARKP